MKESQKERNKQVELDRKEAVGDEATKQPKLKKYTAACTVTEIYYTEVEAADADEAYRLCEELDVDALELDDSTGEWEIEEEEEVVA